MAGSDAIHCYCPADGRLLGTVNPATVEDIDRAITSASTAQKDWAKTSFAQRRRVLKTILRYAGTISSSSYPSDPISIRFVLENQETIATVACLDSGKTKIDASFGEILVTAEKLRWTILHGEKALRPEKRPTNFLMMYKMNEVRWEPLGVVAACVSWNYPFHNLIGPVISSIFAGNAIVVKSSELTAWSASYFTSIVTSALSACGHSPNLVQSVICWPSVAPHLTSHPSIAHLTFIGSRPVAHHVAASAAESLIPCCIELGGKDAAIILDSARPNLKSIASILMRGVFQSAGQNCIGIERIIACPAVYDELVALLEPRVRALRVGSALATSTSDDSAIDVGAMISAANFPTLQSHISSAVASGARLLAGGQAYTHPSQPKGHYFLPTLLVDVPPTCSLAQNETFAPIMTIMRARSAAHALELANSTSYGLGASVFGAAGSAEVEEVVRGVKSGMVSVNDFAVYYAVGLPFGGVGGSGYGRFGGTEGLRSVCNTKAVSRDRFPRLMSTAIPPRLDYPMADSSRAWEFCQGVVGLGYAWWLGSGDAGKGKAIWRLARNA